MKVYQDGEDADFHRVRLGPVAWPDLASAFHDLGWTWADDTGARRRPPGLRATYHLGWLEVGGLPGLRLQRLAAWLAHRTGKPVAIRTDDTHAEVGEVGADLSVESDWLVLRPDGTRDRPPTTTAGGIFYEAENGVPADTLAAFADAATDQVAAPDLLPQPLSGHPDYAGRIGGLKPSDEDPPVDAGPRWTLSLGDATLVVEPGERARAEEVLDLSGRLDLDARKPDLSRWDLRAARRAGLDAPPAPGDPAWPAFHATWLQLSADDRSAPGRRGTIAAWKLRTPGAWGLRAEELAVLASTPGVPADLAAFAARGGAAGIVVG